MSVHLEAREYDSKTLIRHAMVALEDELGVNEAWQYTSRLLAVFQDLKNREARASEHAANALLVGAHD